MSTSTFSCRRLELGNQQPDKIHTLTALVTRLLNTRLPETLHARSRAQSNIVQVVNLSFIPRRIPKYEFGCAACQPECHARASDCGMRTKFNQHCRKREKMARRDIPNRSVTLICPCRLHNTIVLSSPSLAGPCTTHCGQSEPSGVAWTQACTKCPRELFYPRSLLIMYNFGKLNARGRPANRYEPT
jgi:hypothetical protein